MSAVDYDVMDANVSHMKSAAHEQDFIAAVEEGLADAKAGRVVSHEAVVGHFTCRFKKIRRK